MMSAPQQPPTSTVLNTSTHPAVQITQMILQTVTMLAVMWVTIQQNRNTDKIEQVGVKQQQVAAQTEEVQRTVRDVAPSEQSREIQLWTNWRYLQSVYEGSLLPEDKAKADQAKELYNKARDKR